MTAAELPQNINDSILDAIRSRVTPKKFELWFSSLTFLSDDAREVRFSVENAFQLDWIQDKYIGLVETSVASVIGAGRAISLVVKEPTGRELGHTVPAPQQQVVLPRPAAVAPASSLRLNANYTFENFVVGPSNQLAHAAARAVAAAPAGSYNPLFLHGAVGLGKTHLLQAICHQATRGRDLKVLYLSSETFVNEFIAAIEQGDLDKFRYRYRTVDLLLIDDIHLLANKDRTQEEFFHTFNTLYNDKRQIVLSSDCSPSEIPTLRDRLVSRFEWGLVAEIAPPRYETRLAILRRKAKDRGGDIPEEVLAFLAERIERNIRELEGAITKILGYAELFGRPIDLELARQTMHQTGSEPGPRMVTRFDTLLTAVCQRYGVTPADVRGRRRTQSVVLPRQVGMYLTRQLTNMSFEEIGRHFGGRDHSTVLYAVRKIEEQLATDPSMAHLVRALRAELEC